MPQAGGLRRAIKKKPASVIGIKSSRNGAELKSMQSPGSEPAGRIDARTQRIKLGKRSNSTACRPLLVCSPESATVLRTTGALVIIR